MSAIATTIRQLSGRLALLRAERERYQALCAAAYQLAGTVNAPVRFLDALADGANGEIEARQKTGDLLPVDPKETGAFPAWSDAEVEGWKRDAERYRWLRDEDRDTPNGMRELYAVQLRFPHTEGMDNDLFDTALDAAIEAALAQQQGENHE